MTKEYRYMYFEWNPENNNTFDLKDKLNWYGEQGWRLVLFETIHNGTRIWMEKEEEE